MFSNKGWWENATNVADNHHKNKALYFHPLTPPSFYHNPSVWHEQPEVVEDGESLANSRIWKGGAPATSQADTRAREEEAD